MKKRNLLLSYIVLMTYILSMVGVALRPIPAMARSPWMPFVSAPQQSSAPQEIVSCSFVANQPYSVFMPLIASHAGGGQMAAGAIPNELVQSAPDSVISTGVNDFTAEISFLYQGDHPLQSGIASGVIIPEQSAVLRGRVCTRDGNLLPGVVISILDHPEYGNTLTQADGLFDMVVNGGGLLTVNYAKDGYLPSQRQVFAPWNDFTWLPEVALIPLDSLVTTIDLSLSDPMQVAQGSAVSDSDGTRQAILLVPQGTQAEMVLPGGSTQPLTSLDIRATEYTVGVGGPAAMPAELPPSSGYTYALEYSVDEALAAGALDVHFSQPLYHYTENFLNFPVGMIVPVGYYDRQQGKWLPSENGRVVKIISITSGLADLDTDGDGVADNNPALGVTDVERARLAELYTPGRSLWRVPITHFTPWDCNWPYGPPTGAAPPQQKPPWMDNPLDTPQCQAGSVIECQNQILGESADVVGTPFSLNYWSDRTPGRLAAYTLEIPLSSSLPPNLKSIELEVMVAGQRFTRQFPAAPNQSYTFTWDGKNVYGQTLQGKQPITIRIGYTYDAVYQEPAQLGQAFGALSGVPITTNRTRQEVTLWQDWKGMIGGWDNRVLGLGGWSLNVHHVYDSKSKILYLGDGQRRSTESLGGVINTFAGGGWEPGIGVGDGGPAKEAELAVPAEVAVGPDGSVYIVEEVGQRVRKVDVSGIITTVVGIGTKGYSGDGGPATAAMLNDPYGIALAPDGSLYIADRSNHRIRRVDANGIITTVAGTGIYGFSGDGGLATLAKLNQPFGVALGPDGSLYIADSSNERIRRVGLDGIITTIAGNGSGGFAGDGGPATQAQLANPWRVTVGPDGSLYIVDKYNNRIRRVGTDGIITTVAGNGTAGYSGDGGPATQAQLNAPEDVAVGLDGTLYIADANNYRVRWFGSDGIINTVAGNGARDFSGDGGLAIRARLDEPVGIAIAPDGSFYIADWFNQRVRRVSQVLPGSSTGDILIPFENGSELYVFSGSGSHLRTLDALTGAVLYSFAYDSSFHLVSVTDGSGNVTSIERDAGGNPTAIVAPHGQRTTLASDANGYLVNITNPAAESVLLSYTTGGLLASLIDARGSMYSFSYDALGRLTSDAGPAGGLLSLGRTETSGIYTVTVGTALGRTTDYWVEDTAEGDRLRVNTLPNGLQTVQREDLDGSHFTALPDGTQSLSIFGPDPRWSMMAPLAETKVITTPSGLRTSYASASTAVLTDINNPLSLVTLTELESVNGQVYTSVYAAASRLFTLSTPEGRQTTVTLDALGRVVEEHKANLLPTAYAYDSQGRLVTVTIEARVTTISYNSSGYVESITNPLGHTTHFAYDAAGRVTLQTLPDGQVVGYGYDANGNITSTTPPGRPAHTFNYTAANLTSAYTPPDVLPGNDQTVYEYNVDQQLTRITRPDGQTVSFGYDSAGRLNSVTSAGGTISFTYNPLTGNLAGTTTSGGIGTSYAYDGALLTGETWSGTVAGNVGYTYNNDFLITGQIINGSNAITFQYDHDGLLTQAGNLTLQLDPQNSLLVGSTLGSITDTWSTNDFGEASGYEAAFGGTTLYNVQYTRDDLGRITQKTETIGGVTDVYGYSYDLVERLTGVTKNSVTIAVYTYDGNDNRLSYTNSGGTLYGTYDNQDRLTLYGATVYAYTANGELQSKTTSGQITTYQYDALGNLAAVALPNGTQITYLVDGMSRRIGKRVNGSLVQGFLYQGDLKPIAELDGSGNVVSRFVYASRDNVPDYLIKGGTTYRIISDQAGSPRLMANVANGQIAQRMDYDAFGNVTNDTNPGFQPFGFAGGFYDRDIGLVHFGAREYDPETGRWMAKDPILFDGGLTNLYSYVGGDPVNMRDADGLGAPVDYWKPRPQRNNKLNQIKQVPQPPPPPKKPPHDKSKCPLPHGQDDDLLDPLVHPTATQLAEHRAAGYK